jgi:hypothetical protein
MVYELRHNRIVTLSVLIGVCLLEMFTLDQEVARCGTQLLCLCNCKITQI